MRKSRKRIIVSVLIVSFLILCALYFRLRGGRDSPSPSRSTLYHFQGIGADRSVPGFQPDRGAIVESGGRAFCDLQFRTHASDSRFLLSRNARARMDFVSEFHANRNTIKMWLEEGEYFIKGEINESDRMIIHTPRARVTATGHVYISVSESGDRIHAIKGAATIRPIHDLVDDLMSEVWSRSRVLRELEQRLRNHVIIIPEGRSIALQGNKFSVSRPAYAKSNLWKRASRGRIREPEEIRKLVSRLDARGEIAALRIEKEIARKITSWPAPRKPDEKPARIRTDAMRRLAFLKHTGTAATRAYLRAEKADAVLNHLSRCVGRSIETLVLRDTRRHRGIILSDENWYRVLDPVGSKQYPRSLVERVEF